MFYAHCFCEVHITEQWIHYGYQEMCLGLKVTYFMSACLMYVSVVLISLLAAEMEEKLAMNYLINTSSEIWLKCIYGRFQRYVCDILTTFFIFETLQMNVISLQDV